MPENQSALQTALNIFLYGLRVLLPIFAIFITVRCFSSLRRNRRGEEPVVMLVNMVNHDLIPVRYWENSIGRSKNSDITFGDPTVSRDHAVLMRRESGWYITDTGSKAGVYVNGERVKGKSLVALGDILSVGSVTLMLQKSNRVQNNRRKWFPTKKEAKPPAAPASLLANVTVFHLLMAVEACFAGGVFSFLPLIPFGALTLFAWLFYYISTKVLRRSGFELETLGIFLSGIGILLVSGVSVNDTLMQIGALAFGMLLFCFMLWFMEVPERAMKWRLLIEAGAVFLFAVNLVLGVTKNGSQNWVQLGPVSFQPSELVKIAYIFAGASSLDRLQTAKNLTEFILFTAVCIGALFLMGDFGTACIFFVTFLIIAFMRSGDLRTIILICAAAAFGAFIILQFKPYIAHRFAAWGHVWQYADSLGYQQTRVLMYSASGGLFGLGIGNGLLKHVAAATSDLVFGMLCEETGVLLAIVVAACIALLALYARSDISRSRSTLYSISSTAAAGMLVFQSCLNIFGATDVLPLTGVTLPFVSMGGTSLLCVWGLLAFIKSGDERTYAARRKSA